jgi:hypothetical protein
MKTELEQFLLEEAKGFLRSLSDEQFLALTCNLTTLHDGLIRLVHNQSLNRKFRAPNRVTAEIFDRRKDTIKKFLRTKL